MKVREIEVQKIETEVVNTYEMVDRYYWSSRSVYAVEFDFNVYPHDDEKVWNRMRMIEVQFENNIIRNKDIVFCDKYPVTPNKHHRQWFDELFYAYLQEDKIYDYRTKEQFDTDFNNVINHLQSLRTPQQKV